jgi:hypothetical protein
MIMSEFKGIMNGLHYTIFTNVTSIFIKVGNDEKEIVRTKILGNDAVNPYNDAVNLYDAVKALQVLSNMVEGI